MSANMLRAPTARTFSIADLMEHVRLGRMRIPNFQRNYRWDVNNVLDLFDSVYRGYPIGSLLLWLKEAPHDVIALGSLRIEAEATPEALWVVDGQQRITSLAGVLMSVGEVPDPRFALFFDLERKRFVRGRKPAPGHWLPMNRLIDTRALLRWLGELQRSGAADELVTTAEDLSKRIREYQLPAYVVETADESTLRTIFDRLNTFGKALTSAEVFQALHGGRRGEAPEDLRTLGKQIAELGFGAIDDNSLLRAVLALRGGDIYRDFRSEFADHEDPTDAFRDAAQAIERVIAFLRSEARIPHVTVLPYRYVIPVLARFFHLHAQATPRSRTLLRRWLWRDALAPGRRSTPVSLFRSAVRAIDADEHGSVQRLLGSVPRSSGSFEPSLSARLNEAASRASVALMGSWQPRSLVDGQRIDLRTHFEHTSPVLPPIVDAPDWKASLANRMLHPATTSRLGTLLIDSPLKHEDAVSFDEVLESHAVTQTVAAALNEGNVDRFLEIRRLELGKRLESSAARLTEWDTSDRPPLSALVVNDEESNA